MTSRQIPSIAPQRRVGAANVEAHLKDRLVAVSWMSVAAHEQVVIVPSELYRLSAFVSTSETGGRSVELSFAGLQTVPGAFVTPHDGCMIVALLTQLGVAELLGLPMYGTTDRRVLLEDLCPGSDLRPLAESLRSAETSEQAADALRQWIERRMQAQPPLARTLCRTVAAAVELAAPAHDGRLDRLAESLGVTRRQLERNFFLWVGVSPSQYARLARLQRAASALSDGETPAAAAFDNGFTDQPHLTRTSRVMTLLTPLSLRAHAKEKEPSMFRRVLGGRLLFMRMPDAAIEHWRVEALPTGCPLTRFIQSVRGARRTEHRSAADRSRSTVRSP
jgi:methylphosphotriester-DNA--protein-cysteine methyltransferase